eukprot:Gb_00697 [translate_table: standard]
MSAFHRELRVPDKAAGVVIGKGGSTRKAFQKTPGISSVRFSCGKVQIHGSSQEAVQQVASSIEELNCFEKFDSPHISNVSRRNNGAKKSEYCFKSGLPCDLQGSSSSSSPSERSTEYSVDNDDDLSAQFSRKTSITGIFFYPQWDLQAYKDTLLSRLEPLIFQQHETMRTIKLIIRFGKELFFGVDWSEFGNGGFMPLTQVQELCRLERLNQRFSTACAEGAVAPLRLHLDKLKYVKLSSRKKITIRVADLHCKSLQLNVSVRCGNEGSEEVDEKVVISRVRSEPRRHGFVSFCREGKGTTDFRLGVVTHGTEMDVHPDMVEWIDKAWRNRTSDQLLVFDPPTRFLVINIRYKASETYMNDDWKLRIASVRDGDRAVSKMNTRWDCVLSTRWFNENGGLTDDIGAVMGNVGSLVKEAAKVSEHMASSSEG